MSKEVGEMVRSRDVVQAALADEYWTPTGRRPVRAPWRRGSWSASRKRDCALLRGAGRCPVKIYEAWRARAGLGGTASP